MRTAAALAAAGLLVLGGCRAHGAGAVSGECTPAEAGLAPGFEPTDLAGSWELVLVATEGPRADAGAAGTLSLSRWEDGPPAAFDSGRVRATLYGWTDVDPEAVGARTPGRVDSADPARPGVLVFDRRPAGGEGAEGGEGEDPAAGPRILLRLGAAANDPAVVRFEGDYTVLEVTAADGEGFGGTWRSGGTEPVASGHFCARRRRG